MTQLLFLFSFLASLFHVGHRTLRLEPKYAQSPKPIVIRQGEFNTLQVGNRSYMMGICLTDGDMASHKTGTFYLPPDEVTDADGQNSYTTFDISGLPKGTYHLQVAACYFYGEVYTIIVK